MAIKAKYTDPNLEKVRGYVSSKKSSTPILLLPVRIETRFMKVERAEAAFQGSHLVGEILEEFWRTETGFFDYKKELNSRQEKEVIDFFSQKVKEIKTKAGDIDQISGEQKSWLDDAYKSTVLEGNEILKNLGSGNSHKFKKVRDSLESLMKNISSSAPTKTEDILQFTRKMQNLENKMAVFSNGKVPFKRKHKRKQLYDFVSGRVEEVKSFYINSYSQISSVLFLETNLLQKIKNTHNSIKTHLENLGSNIRDIHSDESWKNFVDAHDQLIKDEYVPLVQDFEETSIVHLEEMNQLDVVDANKFLVQSLAVKKAFKKFLKSEHTSYGDVKNLRKQLKRRITNLEKLEKKAIGGNDFQKRQIENQLLDIEQEKNQFNRKLDNLNIGKESQKFGIRTTKNFLPKISKVAAINSKNIHLTNRKNVLEASKSAEHSKSNFQDILTGIDSQDRIGKSHDQKLDEALKTTRVALRKNYQLTRTDFESLNTKFSELKSKVLNSRFESVQVKEEFSEKMHILERSLIDLKAKTMVTGEEAGIQFVLPKKLKNELWLRIYPDDLFVHTHEKKMTLNEIDSAKRYWKISWAVDEDKELVLGAWKSLVASYGNNRAAWIAKAVGGEKIPKNSRILTENPSKEINEAYRKLLKIQKSLKVVSSNKSVQELNTDIDFSALNSQINSALVSFKKLRNKPQLIYFLEKSVSVQQRIHSKFEIIIQIVNESIASNGNQSIVNAIQEVLHSFEGMHSAFKMIKSIRTDQFLENISDPYKYPNTQILQPKEESWTMAPYTKVLPKQFVAIGRNDGQFELIHVGKMVPEKLQLGIDPSTFDFGSEEDNPFQFDENGDLKVEEGMRWMTDFNEAVDKGMGMIIPLSAEQANKGFDELYVIGVNDQTALKDAGELEELLENHHYAASGLEFLKIGTATNNTEDVKTGFSIEEMDPTTSYALEMQRPLFNGSGSENEFEISDGHSLAKLLGISGENFHHIKNSNLHQIADARAMHKALWHSTLGVYMEDMWDKVFTYDNIERTYKYFTKNVVGRGYLPSIRIGSQPYGILPVTSYKRISFSNTFSEDDLPVLNESELNNPSSAGVQKKLQFRYDVRLKRFLNTCNEVWSSLRREHVNHAGNIEKAEDPQKAFMNMLGLNGTSTEFYFRYGVNINDRTSQNFADVGINFTNNDDVIYSPNSLILHFHNFLRQGYFQPSFTWDDQTDPSTDLYRQLNRENSRIKDQVGGSRIFTYRYLNRHSLITGELVSEEVNDKVLPVIGDSKNYIDWLLDPSIHVYHDIFNDNNLDELPSKSILFLLLRQSLLLSYREAAMDILQKDDFFSESFRRLLGSKESYMGRLGQFRTKWTHLLKRMKDINDSFYFNSNEIDEKQLYRFLTGGVRNESVSDYIHRESLRDQFSGRSRHSDFINRTTEIKTAIGHLSTITTEDLQHLLAEHLDTSSYRLDAWILGFANMRLEESRKIQKKGIFLGAYAWVENLRPGGEREEVTGLPDGLTDKTDSVFTDKDNEGYIHAPSINHAISAAILRSGYLANDETEGNLTNRMAVNLTSARVRKAMQLISGLRNGMDLASILGYQFEKGLHERYREAELDKFIYPLRKKFPLIVPIEVSTNDANSSTGNVIHGIDLLESITDTIEGNEGESQNSLFDYLTKDNLANCPDWLKNFVNVNSNENPTQKRKELLAIIREIDEMADSFDALGDLAISESVYQIVNGNHVRAASMLSALADGTILPEPQIINTIRTGRVVTHKVLLHIEDATGKPPKWDADLTPRSSAEPSLNHWLAKKIGDPEQYFCHVTNTSSGETLILQLSELALQPIDLLFLISSNKEKGNADLTDLIKDRLRIRENVEAEHGLSVDIINEGDTWPKNAKSFYQLDWLLGQCKAVIHNSRPFGYTDVHIPSENRYVDNPDHIEFSDLKSRVNQVQGDLREFINLVKDFVEDPTQLQTPASFKKAYQFLVRGTTYGITSLLADLKRDFNESEAKIVLNRLKKILELLEKRNAVASESMVKAANALSTSEKAHELVKAVKSVLGENFPFMPGFQNHIKNEIKAQVELPAGSSLIRYSSCTLPMEEWLQGIANVRSKMYAVEMLKMFEGNSDMEVKDLQPVQFPYKNGDYWLGTEFPEDFEAGEDKLSLVLMNPEAAKNEMLQKGLLIDEWVEIIPNKEETTGVSFQYEQPDSTPPQSLLLAVSPKVVTSTSKWEWDDLVYTLMDTLELARNRTVEPDQLEKSMLGQVLPSIISEVVPPQLTEAFETDDDAHKNVLGAQVVLDYESNLPNKE